MIRPGMLLKYKKLVSPIFWSKAGRKINSEDSFELVSIRQNEVIMFVGIEGEELEVWRFLISKGKSVIYYHACDETFDDFLDDFEICS